MPRQAIDYSKTVIYKIVCRDLTIEDCYVGSTTDFRNRNNTHKTSCKKNTQKLYVFINSNGGWDNWDMIEIEKYECNDSNEKRSRERYWIEELKAKLNMRKSISSDEEKKDYFKNYRMEKKDYFKNYQMERAEDMKEYFKNHSKKYNIENAEKLKLYRHEYYLKHK